jgi:hypothetical protein
VKMLMKRMSILLSFDFPATYCRTVGPQIDTTVQSFSPPS